ncbi:MAG: DUF4124 domain-containing protein [Thiogranum sp.]|nr:DUF4124 domain-containing protein [Thiogranum sp.]
MYWKRLACVVFCLAAWPGQAEVYRWVDEQGQVHYEDQPRDSKTRKLSPPSVPVDGAGGDSQRMEKTRRLLNAYESERQQAREEKAERRKQAEEQRRKCIGARDDLRHYEESGSIYRLDGEGKRVYYSDAEREALIAKYREAIAKWCE